MSTLLVTVNEEQERFLSEQVRSGAFPDADAVVRAALDQSRRRSEQRAARAVALRQAARVALDEIERGEGVEVTDLDAYFAETWREAEAEVERRAADRRRA